MPNWITNKVTAPPHVISAMLNEAGDVDFNSIVAFTGPHLFDTINCDSEYAARRACGAPVDAGPVLAALQADSRARIDLRTMRDDSFGQFIEMLQNFRACGYLHSMEFARDKWGTKWNACESQAAPDAGRCEFETAWSCPQPFFSALSKRFPESTISVTFADEDIGSNCGTIEFKGGNVVRSDIAPKWKDMDEAVQSKWRAFAYEVKGWTPDDD